MSDEDFHAFRRAGIGGSDIAGLLGMSPWQTPVGIWAEKTGRVGPQAETPAMRAGRHMESAVLSLYGEVTGADTVGHPPPLVRDEILRGHLDAMRDDGVPVEAKTARSAAGWGEPGTDEIPTHYLAQGLWYCGLTDAPRIDVAVLVGGLDFSIYHVSADPELFARMADIAKGFWRDYVVNDRPPPPSKPSDMNLLWPQSICDSKRVVDADVADLCARALDMKGRIVAEQALLDELEDRIKLAHQDAEGIVCGNRLLATYKTRGQTRLDAARLVSEQPSLAARYQRTTYHRVLLIKRSS